MTFPKTILTITAIMTALTAGLLFAYSCSVNPGLHRLPDKEYLLAMQSINAAIQNPVFFAAFFGALIGLPVSALLCRKRYLLVRPRLLAAAAVLYAIGVIGVTAFGNVPLNDALASFDISAASPQSLAHQRALFEAPWNTWHTVRTLAALLALVLALTAFLFQSGQDQPERHTI